MLYACENVRTLTYGAKLNTPPMAAFRAPGFVEGTFGLECLLDELAAKLDLDPLELRRRNHADNDLADGRPFSSKNLMECYGRAEQHWERRTRCARARRDRWKRGVGLASQIWYGGGGPPSYAWVRVGSDGRAVVITAMQDIGTGTRTAMAQIAAEELGLPLERVELRARRLGARPVRLDLGRLVDDALDGPGGARRRRRRERGRSSRSPRSATTLEERVLSLKDGKIVSADGGSWPLEEVIGLLEDAQILGKGARGPNPTGMRVLTFGVQVAEVAVDVETGEVRVERDRGDPRRRPRDQPARRAEPGRGRDHPGRSGTRSPRSGCSTRRRARAHADARRVQAADDRRRAGDRHRASSTSRTST